MTFIGLFVVVLPMLVIIPLFSVRLHLKPLRERARQRRLPMQYALTDILILLGMISASGSILSTIPNPNERMYAMVFIWPAVVASWYYALRLVSQAGVKTPRKRIAIQAFAVPYAAFGIYFLWALLMAVHYSTLRYETPLTEVDRTTLHFFWLSIQMTAKTAETVQRISLALWLVLFLVWIIVPRRLAHWAIASENSMLSATPAALPQDHSDAPLLDPHVKDLKLK